MHFGHECHKAICTLLGVWYQEEHNITASLLIAFCCLAVSVEFNHSKKIVFFFLIGKDLWGNTLRLCKYPNFHNTLTQQLLASIVGRNKYYFSICQMAVF